MNQSRKTVYDIFTRKNSTGKAFWNDAYADSYGVRYEPISAYAADDGAFAVIRDCGSTKHIVSGHNHINNFVINYNGIKLIFSLKCGAGGYWRSALNGGTVLTVNSDGISGTRHEFVNVEQFLTL